MKSNTHKYSEIFYSFQGEGNHTGKSTCWIRLFACNLTCAGFGQQNPTDPSTYIEPYKEFDVSLIETVEELPVWEYGCDSSYTWSKRFKHLMKEETAAQICDHIQEQLKHPSNPKGLFQNPTTKQWNHMAFTGGEPLLKFNQVAIVDILREFRDRDNMPKYVTIETNGTQPLIEELRDMIYCEYHEDEGREWFWSISPKLWSTAGEKPKKAIKPACVEQYAMYSPHGQLKYVVNGTDESWKEVENNTAMYRAREVEFPVYIMPVGATTEEQSESVIADIAVDAMKRGYHFSGRLHCYVFGNAIGT